MFFGKLPFRTAAFAPVVYLLFCVGCGQGSPAGVPELYPTTVVVVKSGTPVANANVMLIPDTAESGDWSVSGKTDATGAAIIETFAGGRQKAGAPEGGYKVYITKIPKIEEPDPNLPDEEYALERQKRVEAAENEIPPAFSSIVTSGLTIIVAPKTGANETFDVDGAE